MSEYYQYETVTARGDFTLDAVAVNPATVELVIVKPDTTTIEKAKADMENPTTGRFEYDFDPDLTGLWDVYMRGESDDVARVLHEQFTCIASRPEFSD